ATARRHASSSVTSSATQNAAPPISRATASPRAASRLPTATVAPARASPSATARPIPRLAPVTRATFPARTPIRSLLGDRLELEVGPTEPNGVVVDQVRAVDPLVVDEGTVRRAEIVDAVPGARRGELGVPRADRRIAHHHIALWSGADGAA